MTRRELLALGLAIPFAERVALARGGWRTFEITTDVDLQGPAGAARVWIPIPDVRQPYQRDVDLKWNSATATVQRVRGNVPMIVADWKPGAPPRTLSVTARVSTRDWQVALDVSSSDTTTRPDASFLRPTTLIPVDGIVRETALAITSPHRSDLAKARAIYDWIVENTLRDPTVRGCGLGDIRWMLETRTFAGKCADLNSLFVGLARAAGLPARDVYGLRVAPSATYPSLGRSGDVTGAQHCRAEVYVSGLGWIPVDPADVAKVRLEERGNGPLDDAYLRGVRERLFGSWEMNWIAFNDSHDVTLPGSRHEPLPFFMYPCAEIERQRMDSLDAARFRYRITAYER